MAKEMKVINDGTNKFYLEHLKGFIRQGRPIELHYITDGTITNEPNFAMVIEMPGAAMHIIGQFSLATLQECLDELGYEIKKKEL